MNKIHVSENTPTKGYGLYGFTAVWCDEQGKSTEKSYFGHGRSAEDAWRKVEGETAGLIQKGWKLVHLELKWFIKH